MKLGMCISVFFHKESLTVHANREGSTREGSTIPIINCTRTCLPEGMNKYMVRSVMSDRICICLAASIESIVSTAFG